MFNIKTIMWICTLAIIISTFINNIFIKTTIITLGILISIITFYKNVHKITNLSQENVKVKTMKNISIAILLFIISIILVEFFNNKISANMSNKILLTLFTIFIIYLGNLAPTIPCNRYVGLRFPWTVNDAMTWRYAHNILGYISFPSSILMFLIGYFYDFKTGVLLCIAIITFIPSILSFVYYKKTH